jgi:hypothetical protein
MQTLVHADIFFFVSTIVLVVLSILVAIGLYFAIGIMRDVRAISARVNKASQDIEKDLGVLRSAVKAEGNKVKGIADALLGFVIRKLTPKAAKRKKVKEDDEEDL